MNYKYFQPEYVSRFQCNGEICPENCCKKNWRITIDEKTYNKYLKLEEQNPELEITRHIAKLENGYKLIFGEKNCCPFLTENGWCSIQKRYGEEFLSEICRTFPRIIWNFYDGYECTLSLTCPLAMEMILFSDEPLKFEKIEIPESVHNKFDKLNVNSNAAAIPFEDIIQVQETSIRILQERALTIDKRLLMLGLYFDKLEEIFNGNGFNELEKVDAFYRDSKFLTEQAAQISPALNFNAAEHIRIMFGILEILYGAGNNTGLTERLFIGAITKALKIEPDENNQISLTATAQNYLALDEQRQNFINKFSTIFENYLVNEFFYCIYPFNFNFNINLNYGMFLTIYKMLELSTFSISLNWDVDPKTLADQIVFYNHGIDHNRNHLNKIEAYLKDKSDIVEIMQDMLKV